MTTSSDLKLYSTQAHPCSYLKDKQATTVFIDPNAQLDSYTYSRLSELGFRRSGPHVYRPSCLDCEACIPARVITSQFQLKRSHYRIWKKNQDLQVKTLKDIGSDEFYRLYERYICQRHADGDMYPPSREQFDTFLTSEWDITDYYCFYLKEQLLAVTVTDVMDNGLSAMYSFFEPEQAHRSLGVYAILWQIEQAKRLELPYLFMGYWIKDCKKMNYKIDYRPLELLINQRWTLLR